MNKKKFLPVILIGSIVGEALISARHFDSDAPQPHVDFETAVPFVFRVTAISAGMASVIYMSSGFADKNGGRPGRMTDPKIFPSVEDAMRALFPSRCESATLWAEKCRYAYHSPRFGWELC